ncbi:MAG: hypothetical protein RJB66_269 [Pseudomonadota bacterium]|jgi:hypothetical protein
MKQVKHLGTFILMATLTFSHPSLAEEVDDFTSPIDQPSDAAPVLDLATNALLDDLIVLLNKSAKGCNDPLKYELATKKLDQNFTAIGNGLRAGPEIRELLQKLKQDPTHKNRYKKRMRQVEEVWLAEFPIGKREIFSQLFSSIDYFGQRKIEDSVYHGMDYPTCCTSRINLNGVFVGLDKVDHFFGNGGLLFEQLLKITPSDLPLAIKLKKIMDINVRQEHSLWGLKGLSPKSYGDLASNWQGVKFYRRLFDVAPNYIQCSDGVFKKNPRTTFHIADYVDELWNESFNCSSFISENDYDRFKKNLSMMGLSCPRNQRTCDRLIKRHKADPLFITHAVNPACSGSEPNFKFVENPELITWEEVGLSLRGFTWPIIKDLAVQKGGEFVEKVRLRYSSKHHKKDPQLSDGREAFDQLRLCNQTNEAARLDCLQRYTEPGLAPDQINKFSAMTDHQIDMSPLDYCPPDAEKSEAALHPKPIGDFSLCFKTNYKTYESIGRVYFRKNNDGPKILLMRY